MKTPIISHLLTLPVATLLLHADAPAATVVSAQAANAQHSTDSAFPSFWTNNFSTTNDLLLGLSPAATGNFDQPFGGMTLTTVNDGSLTAVPTNGANLSMFAGVGPGAGTQLVYNLAQASYISSIGYFGGWVDAGRCDINFTVSYSTDNGATYIALIDPTGASYATLDDPLDIHSGGMNSGGTTTFSRTLGGTGPISNFVNVTDNATTYLGNNAAITNLKFDFGSVSNTWAGLEALTATGVAVPEPSSSALVLGAAGLCLLRRRRA